MRRVIEPMLAGTALNQASEDDIAYLIDLGLCRMAPGKGLTIANPIYREVLPRALAFTLQALSRDRPAPGSDGLPQPRRGPGARIRHRFWADGPAAALWGGHPRNGTEVALGQPVLHRRRQEQVSVAVHRVEAAHRQ